jgi:cell division transport system permease protein
VIAARVGSALRRTARIALERPRVAAWTLAAVTCALVVAGVAWIAADAVEHWSPASHAGGSMVVYLGEGVDDAMAHRLTAQLAALPGVERAQLIAPAESARRLEQALGADAALLDGVELDALPGSVEVTLAPGVRDVIAMSPTLRALRGTSGVDDVVVDAPERERGTAPSTVRAVAWTAAGLLALLALVVAIASLRVRLERDRHEQRVLHLLGASPAFAAVPTALAGALLGGVAAVLAAIVVWVGLARCGDAIASALAIELGFPAASAVLVFVALGAAAGFVGGGLAGGARVAR